jgi:hypothetical protein
MLVFVAMNLRPTWQNGFKARNQHSLCIPKISIPQMAARCAARCSCQARLCYIWYIYNIYIYIFYIYISLSLSPSPSPRVQAICGCYFHFKCFLWISRGPTGCPRGARGQATARCRVNIGDGLTARLLCPGGHLRDEVPLTKRLQHVTIIEGFICQWIGLRENLQETMVFTIKYRAFL